MARIADAPPFLAELKAANVPALTWRDVFKVTDGSEEPSTDDQTKLDDYLRQFMEYPRNDEGHALCPGCRNSFGKGDMLSNFLMAGMPGRTTLEWGLAHGVMHCTTCSYPFVKLHHDIGGTGDDALIKFLDLALPAHPSTVAVIKTEGTDHGTDA